MFNTSKRTEVIEDLIAAKKVHPFIARSSYNNKQRDRLILLKDLIIADKLTVNEVVDLRLKFGFHDDEVERLVQLTGPILAGELTINDVRRMNNTEVEEFLKASETNATDNSRYHP